jgi:MFS family permease
VIGDGTMLGPMRHRDFRLLWIGACASLLGDGVYLVALAWQAYTLTNRPAGLALLGVCATVPQLAALLAGGIVSDRFERRRVLLIADVVRAVAVGVVAMLVIAGQARIWHLAVMSIVYGLGAGFAAPAFDAILPSLVPDHELEQANALDQFLRPAMLRLAGPALGGVLIATGGPGVAFLLNAVTFLVSAAALFLMRRLEPQRATGQKSPSPQESLSPKEGSLWAETLSGIQFVRGRVWLWGTFVAATVAYLMFIGPTEVLLPYIVKHEMHGNAGDLGLILAAGGLGALVAAAVMSATGLPRRQLTFMYLAWTVATLFVAGYGLAQTRWQLAVACIAINALEAAGTIAWATTKQRLVPGELMGRVSSLDWFISIAGLPVSYALTAPVAALIGARQTLIAAGVFGAIATIAALFLPGMRDADGAHRQPAPALEEVPVR